MNASIPVPSDEVRWFLEGDLQEHELLIHWLSEASAGKRPIGSPDREFQASRDSDSYLLIPGGTDIGLKWRDRKLQIKARTALSGIHIFAGRHTGHVESGRAD